MSARDFLIAYACIGLAYTLPKLFGFLDFMRDDKASLSDIPGPPWLVSGLAAVIVTSGALILTMTWPWWMFKNFFSRGK